MLAVLNLLNPLEEPIPQPHVKVNTILASENTQDTHPTSRVSPLIRMVREHVDYDPTGRS